MKRKSIFISEEQEKKLEQLAERTKLKQSELIRRAIDQYLKKEGD